MKDQGTTRPHIAKATRLLPTKIAALISAPTIAIRIIHDIGKFTTHDKPAANNTHRLTNRQILSRWYAGPLLFRKTISMGAQESILRYFGNLGGNLKVEGRNADGFFFCDGIAWCQDSNPVD